MAKKKKAPAPPAGSGSVSVLWSKDSPLTAAERKAYQDKLNAQLNTNLPALKPRTPAEEKAAQEAAKLATVAPGSQPPTATTFGAQQLATAAAPTSALPTSAGPTKKGPSFSGPTTSGWTAGSLTPQATVVQTLPPPVVAPPPVGAPPPPLGGPSDLSKYNLTEAELGLPPDLRKSKTQTTPLEQLLAQMFPDAAESFQERPETDPLADPRAGQPYNSLLGTILGNLGTQPGGGAAPQPVPVPNNFAALNIPGAPPFLAGATNNLQSGWMAPQVPLAGGNPLVTLGGVASLAAEQRAQQAEQMKAQKQAETDYFKQQQQQQKAKSMAAQRQRQRFGSVNATTSGWSSNPVLY